MLDAAIVGAGPAGSWTAYLLARQGARVRLFDPSHPREKPCGGGVTGRALSLVSDALGDETFDSVRIRAARFVDHESGSSVAVPLDTRKGPALLVASRREFDGRLLDAARRAGAELVSARVSDVAATTGGFRLVTADGRTHEAATIVGADGPNSLVRRRLSAPFRRDQLSIATGFFAHGTTSDEIVLDIMQNPAGYIWSFPRANHLAIGICAQANGGTTAAMLRERTRRWMDKTSIGAGARLEEYSWPIPSLSSSDLRTLTPSGPGWLLVGDAAGLVDPVTREGIFFALESATLAAGALTSAPDPASRYCSMVRRNIVSELARAAQFKAGFFRPRFSRLLLRALAGSDAIGRVMADLIAGTQSYRTLPWRLAKTMEVRLACELLGTRD